MSCNLGIHNAITKVLNNKPWFKYKQGDSVIEILDSLQAKINKYNSIGVAKTVANTINKAINNGYKNIGDIVYAQFNSQGRGIINIFPTNKQLDLINAQDESEIVELQRQVDLENQQKEFDRLSQESNTYINKKGDVVSKDDLQYQKLTQEEKAKTIEQVTKEHRSIAALKDLAAKLAYRIGGKVEFVNRSDVDWKGYNQGMTSVLNEAFMDESTTFHEIMGHPIIRALKSISSQKESVTLQQMIDNQEIEKRCS